VVELKPGQVHSVGSGPVPASVAVTRLSDPASDGKAVSVELTVVAGDGREDDFKLRVGDRFEIGPEIWTVCGHADHVVHIARVDESERGGPVIASRQHAEEMRRRYDFPKELWQQSLERVRRAEQERARELFGDRKPFAIPEEPTDA
jgi:Family of unknown function (DUF6406)